MFYNNFYPFLDARITELSHHVTLDANRWELPYIPLKTINSKSSKHNKNNNSNKRSKEAVKEVTRKCHTVQGNAKQQQDNSLDNSNMTGVKEVQGQ